MSIPSLSATLTPFVLNFRSDNYETSLEANFGTDPGFQLQYVLDATNC